MISELTRAYHVVVLTGIPCTGLTGLTAYFGLLDVGKVKAGDFVVVSGAAGTYVMDLQSLSRRQSDNSTS